ncbi:MAG: hypothetical protein GX447_01835 [Elusimicrobia bacterium]|nr:hypothetical protein [Elusimicrobiota bacterium]
MTYIKLFAAGFVILFFIHLIAYNYKPYVIIESFINGIFGGLAFVLLGLINHIIGKSVGLPKGETLKTVYEHEETKSSSPAIIKETLKNFYSSRKMIPHREEENLIVFRSPISFKSIGTLIEYSLKTENGKTNIRLKTKPLFKTVILDYGASYSEMKYAKEILSKII